MWTRSGSNRWMIAGVLLALVSVAQPVRVGLCQQRPSLQLNSQPTQLVDLQTAGFLERGSFDLDIRMYPKGGLLARMSVGIADRILIGLSYGGQNIIGQGRINWNPRIEFLGKYRLIDESYLLPGVAPGFSSQGYGEYSDDRQRYAVKSPGFFLAMSKSYALAGVLGFHGGLYYSLERADGDDNISFYAGFDKSLNPELVLLVEYDLALNDDTHDGPFGTGKGYLNMGLRWTFAGRLNLEFDVRDVLRNAKGADGPGRGVRIFYVEHF